MEPINIDIYEGIDRIKSIICDELNCKTCGEIDKKAWTQIRSQALNQIYPIRVKTKYETIIWSSS